MSPLDVPEIVSTLAGAHGPKELAAGHRTLAQAITRARMRTSVIWGRLASAYAEAMMILDQQKADGVSLEDRMRGLEQTLRAAWPVTRAWHYVCQRCDDTGWVFHVCTVSGQCGRPFRLPGAKSDDTTGHGRCGKDHTYVEPCSCSKGQAHRESLQPRQTTPGDFTDAARSRKPTRIGRR